MVEASVARVVVCPVDVAADRAALGGVVVIGAVQGEVALADELRPDAVQPAGDDGHVDDVTGLT